MNSEVGTGSADFTYIKKAVCFEVGTRNADFETAKVGIRSADFKMNLVFFFFLFPGGSRHTGCRLSNSESRHPQCRLSFLSVRLLLEVGTWIADLRTVEVGNPDADFISIMHSAFLLRDFVIN